MTKPSSVPSAHRGQAERPAPGYNRAEHITEFWTLLVASSRSALSRELWWPQDWGSALGGPWSPWVCSWGPYPLQEMPSQGRPHRQSADDVHASVLGASERLSHTEPRH